MFKFVLHLLLVRFVLSSDSEDILEALNLKPDLRQAIFKDGSNFPGLQTYHANAKKVDQTKYPWIAKIIHSRTNNIPHVCTAICIDDAIYITSARCIYSLKVHYTTIHHMSKKFEVLAFVLPSKPTMQMFDDIGIIVVDKNKAKNVKWQKIILFNRTNRTDKNFKWISKLNTIVGKLEYNVVGYALKRGTHRERFPDRIFDLRELGVTVSHIFCNKILQARIKGKGFNVPCYHSCTLKQFQEKQINPKCKNYLGVGGAALIEIGKPNKLVGVVTWAAYDAYAYERNIEHRELPVGFSVVNSENFFKDLSCARRIRGDKGVNVKKDHYQKLCDSKQ